MPDDQRRLQVIVRILNKNGKMIFKKKKEVEYVAKNDEYIAIRESESFM